MPIIYLSPSTQEWNYFVTGGTEEQYMNQLADLMVPYLDASGIRYVRNTPDMTAASSIAASNAGNFDLHLALHSNAAPEGQYGTARGSLIFYYPGSVQGEKAAQIVADGLKAIYPVPNLVQLQFPPPPLVRCAGSELPLFSLSWHSMTTWRTQTGSSTTWAPSPAILFSPSLNISRFPFLNQKTAIPA